MQRICDRKRRYIRNNVAISVEKRMEYRRLCSFNPEVVGSSPASATKLPPKSLDLGGFSTSRGHRGFEPEKFDPILTPIGVLESSENMGKWG